MNPEAATRRQPPGRAARNEGSSCRPSTTLQGMSAHDDQQPNAARPEEPLKEPDGPPSSEREQRDEQVGRAAQRFGKTLGKFARRAGPEAERLRQEAERLAQRARPEAERLAQRARPEAERLAQKARAAADAARPHVERAGREAIQYARDHEDEIKRAALTGAEFTARRAVPLPLRPIVNAVEDERRRRPPLRDDRAPEDPPKT